MSSPILIDGIASDGRIDVTDSSVLRGDGCFEVMRVYDGVPFAVDRHLDRLSRSAGALDISLPNREEIADWVRRAIDGQSDCVVRIIVTRGSAAPTADAQPKVIVFSHGFERVVGSVRLMPVVSPWHGAGVDWALAGAKTLSYAPNLAAIREAQAGGYDDALLVSRDGDILEGPTFSLAWVVDGAVETPSLDLGILNSITRQIVIEEAGECGLALTEGEWQLDRLTKATEVMAISTIREVQPVSAIGQTLFDPGEATALLAKRFAQRRG
ncbi:MAG: aminotransferase class IV family protein [Acidobacteria bacterium]|nr:aminotransferase class IV family protein [Acidobacteriota bacterium]